MSLYEATAFCFSSGFFKDFVCRAITDAAFFAFNQSLDDSSPLLAFVFQQPQTGRIQLFETMKRDGAGSLGNVVMPQGSDAIHRPVSNLGKGG